MLPAGMRPDFRVTAGGGEATQVTKNGGEVAFESPDRKQLYFSKAGGLWKMPVEGGQESQVVESLSYPFNFVVVDQGIYFISGKTLKLSLEFFDLATRLTEPLVQTDKRGQFGLTISPDKQSILYSQLDRFGTDLMLVENFR